AFSDVKYVEPLIGKDTINTLPMDTIDAFRDHGKVTETITQDIDHAHKVMNDLKDGGINIDDITKKLEDEGIMKFKDAYDKLLKSIDSQKYKKRLEK
ncbi:transaldolase family protein, partial [Gelidibacter sp.]|uniref:transaldolase family protein n=1 Tax=Gelidibacter sp. TaxID=2018083 RepID=UPI0032630289